jgi:hypothetical protein
MMSRHVADKRRPSNGGRVKHFLRIERGHTEQWHRSEAKPVGARRPVEFLRIARGRAV